MQDAVEMPSCERRRCGADLNARADDVDVLARGQSTAQCVEPVAVAGEVDADAIGHFAPP